MGTRTVQVIGEAYSETGSCALTMEFNGSTVFDGTVAATAATSPAPNTSKKALFEFEVPDTLSNLTAPSRIVVTEGTIFISTLAANKSSIDDLTQFVEIVYAAPALKTNVTIDGVLLDAVEPEDGWHYRVEPGETLEIDWALGPLPIWALGSPGIIYAADMVPGQSYKIVTPGSVDFTALGAADNNKGTIFVATNNTAEVGIVFDMTFAQ
jgi:hypothetical protein